MTTSVSQFVGKLHQAADGIAKGRKGALLEAAKAGRVQMMHAPGVAATVGGKKIDVKVKPVGQDSVLLKWGPPGWVRILNDRTKPHFIGPSGKGRGGSLRKQGSRKGSRRASGMAIASLLGGTVGAGTKGAIGIRNVGPRAWAHHPGTKGKHFVEAGKDDAAPVIVKTLHLRGVTEPLREVFRG